MLSSRLNCYHYCFFCGTDLCLDFLSTPGFPHTGISPLPGGLRFPDSAGAFHYEESAKLQSITSNRFIHWWETNTQTQMSDVTLIVVFKDWTFQQLSNLFYVLSLLWQTVNLLNCLVKFVLIFMICWGLCLVPETPRRCFKKMSLRNVQGWPRVFSIPQVHFRGHPAATWTVSGPEPAQQCCQSPLHQLHPSAWRRDHLRDLELCDHPHLHQSQHPQDGAASSHTHVPQCKYQILVVFGWDFWVESFKFFTWNQSLNYFSYSPCRKCWQKYSFSPSSLT